MRISGSIFLIAVGGILAFAVRANLSGLDIHAVGWILMAAGLVALLVSLAGWNRAQSQPGGRRVMPGETVEKRRVTTYDDMDRPRSSRYDDPPRL